MLGARREKNVGCLGLPEDRLEKCWSMLYACVFLEGAFSHPSVVPFYVTQSRISDWQMDGLIA